MAQYSKLTEDDIQKILERFNLKLIGYEPIEGGAGNTSYLLRTSKNQYVLTVFEIDNERVVNLCQLLNLLEKHDFPTTRIEKMANGDEITIFRRKPVMLKPFIVGQVVRYLDENMENQVGEAIAKLHQIPTPDYLLNRHAYGLETFPRIQDQGINLKYETWLAQKYEYLLGTIPSGLPSGLIHGDIFYDNVLFEGTKFKALIDFEDACRYYKIFDIGMAVVGLCTENEKIVLSKVSALVKGYQKISKLEKIEADVLKLFIEYAAVATSSWRFWKYYIDTPMVEKSNKHCEMVNIANDARAIPKQEFINAVFL